jgi:hypothetical protein
MFDVRRYFPAHLTQQIESGVIVSLRPTRVNEPMGECASNANGRGRRKSGDSSIRGHWKLEVRA